MAGTTTFKTVSSLKRKYDDNEDDLPIVKTYENWSGIVYSVPKDKSKIYVKGTVISDITKLQCSDDIPNNIYIHRFEKEIREGKRVYVYKDIFSPWRESKKFYSIFKTIYTYDELYKLIKDGDIKGEINNILFIQTNYYAGTSYQNRSIISGEYTILCHHLNLRDSDLFKEAFRVRDEELEIEKILKEHNKVSDKITKVWDNLLKLGETSLSSIEFVSFMKEFLKLIDEKNTKYEAVLNYRKKKMLGDIIC